VYFAYVKDRGTLIALVLALVAILVTASYEDLLSGLALIGLLYFAAPAIVGFLAFRRKVRGDGDGLPKGWWRHSLKSLALFVVVVAIALITGKTEVGTGKHRHSVHSWAGAYNDFRLVGALFGAALLLALVGLWIPRWAASRRVCPDCRSWIDGMASVCQFCGHRWADCLLRPRPVSSFGQLVDALFKPPRNG
jgi:hypothetical protein